MLLKGKIIDLTQEIYQGMPVLSRTFENSDLDAFVS